MSTVDDLAKNLREISISEFFEKNRHLLGFDSRIKALLTTVKEAVDNALDACEEYYYISKGKAPTPDILVKVEKTEDVYHIIKNNIAVGEVVKRGDNYSIIFEGMRASFRSKYAGHNFEVDGHKIKIVTNNERMSVYVDNKIYDTKLNSSKYRVTVRDNGPGISKENIPNIFGKLLYGSKFHRLKQSRGQQGIGITAAVLYGQITTGRPAVITSKIKGKKAYRVEVMIDTSKNKPEIISTKEVEFSNEHGTQIEIELEGIYLSKGEKSVYEYIRRTAIVNPHATITFIDPSSNKFVFKRTTDVFPKEPMEIKPHPYGLELGMLIKMLKYTKRRSVQEFLSKELSRVSEAVAKRVLEKAGIDNKKPSDITRDEAERILKALQREKLLKPPTNCLSPIGAELLEKSLRKDTGAEFAITLTRPPTVYRGIPFQVEVGLAYGGEIKQFQLLRYANKIPLQYDQSSGAIVKAVNQVGWKRYNIQESQSGLPQAPLVVLVHLASVWVPYTSEGKSAIANYPVIIREIKLALQDAARGLKRYLSGKHREIMKKERAARFVAYGEEVAYALSNLTGVPQEKIIKAIKKLIESKYKAKVE